MSGCSKRAAKSISDHSQRGFSNAEDSLITLCTNLCGMEKSSNTNESPTFFPLMSKMSGAVSCLAEQCASCGFEFITLDPHEHEKIAAATRRQQSSNVWQTSFGSILHVFRPTPDVRPDYRRRHLPRLHAIAAGILIDDASSVTDIALVALQGAASLVSFGLSLTWMRLNAYLDQN